MDSSHRYLLLVGYRPFDPTGMADDLALSRDILAHKYDGCSSAEWASVSPEARAVVRLLLGGFLVGLWALLWRRGHLCQALAQRELETVHELMRRRQRP